MKRLATVLVAVILLMTSCGQNVSPNRTSGSVLGLSWQEQYDLGVRYLSEGNYEEAIIAFTAAIEIDPKQALAYVGRGQAYVLSRETEENLTAAQADFETALDLDETLVDAWLGLADIYILRGDYNNALQLMQDALAQANNEQIFYEKMQEIKAELQLNMPQIISAALMDDGAVTYNDIPPILFMSIDQAVGYAGYPSVALIPYIYTNSQTGELFITGSHCTMYWYDGASAIHRINFYENYGEHTNQKEIGFLDIEIGDSYEEVLQSLGLDPTLFCGFREVLLNICDNKEFDIGYAAEHHQTGVGIIWICFDSAPYLDNPYNINPTDADKSISLYFENDILTQASFEQIPGV